MYKVSPNAFDAAQARKMMTAQQRVTHLVYSDFQEFYRSR